ncbi:hypothetical protein J2Y41_001298 [Arthrobacter sp. 1088]|nr:hypothetical protein [Arthrobacter sp. 1088]
MSKSRQYFLSLSVTLGACVVAVGLVPEPAVFIVGLLVMGLLIGITVYYKQWQWTRIKAGEARSPGLGVACVTAMTVALLLRGTGWSPVLVPAFSVAVSGGMFLWLEAKGGYLDPEQQ